MKRLRHSMNYFFSPDSSADDSQSYVLDDDAARVLSPERSGNRKFVDLTPKEYQIIRLFLIRTKGNVVSFQDIFNAGQQGKPEGFQNGTVIKHISNLKRKMEMPCFESVKNLGYRSLLNRRKAISACEIIGPSPESSPDALTGGLKPAARQKVPSRKMGAAYQARIQELERLNGFEPTHRAHVNRADRISKSRVEVGAAASQHSVGAEFRETGYYSISEFPVTNKVAEDILSRGGLKAHSLNPREPNRSSFETAQKICAGIGGALPTLAEWKLAIQAGAFRPDTQTWEWCVDCQGAAKGQRVGVRIAQGSVQTAYLPIGSRYGFRCVWRDR